MQLTKENLRGDHFELWKQNSSGGYDPVVPVSERSYLGTVEEYPGAIACGILADNGTFRGAVYFDRGVSWWTTDDTVVSTRALDYGIDIFTAYKYPSTPSVSAGQAGSTMYGFDVGVDADYDYFNGPGGGNIAKTFEHIEYSVCLVRAIYMKDVLLQPYLGRVIIRASLPHDPYTGLTQGDYLSRVRTEWNDNHTDADRDLVAGVSPSKIGGGLAWVGVVATSSGYSVSQGGGSDGRFDVVWRHEMGHNWDMGHYIGDNPEGAGLMGGNAPGRFSGCEAYRVFNHRNHKFSYLDNQGTYTTIPMAPYAALDAAEFIQSITTSLSFAVLENDYDANGETISLDSFDMVSAKGGTITRQGQELIYTAPGAYLGIDYFIYTIEDSSGQTAAGVVIVDIKPNDLTRLHLTLDETTGTTAYDTTAFANHGNLEGDNTFDASSVTGHYSGGLTFDGEDDHIGVSGVNFASNTVTITAWVKPNGTQGEYTGIISSRSDGAANLNYKSNNELGYHWNNSNYGYSSGLSTPSGVWTFVAMVIEPDKVTFYTYDGSTLNSVERIASHSPDSFYGTISIGRDDNGSRYFDGAMDDVRIYSIALNAGQVLDIASGGGAESPRPFNGAAGVPTATTLQWAMGAGSVNNDIYLGTSYNSVANAGIASLQYMGRQSQASYQTNVLTANTDYFWRIDQVTADGTIIAGPVWQFTTGGNLGGITREAWLNVSGSNVSNLTSDSDYPDNPDISEIINSLEGPTNWAENYGTRIHGFLVPPTTGDYTFWIASDDNSELWLSTDADPANATSPIAEISGWNKWTNSREWDKYPADQQSDPITLTAGAVYYIMALQKEGGGGDNLAVAWSGPGISQQVIPGTYLAPYEPGLSWGPAFDANPLITDNAVEGYAYSGTVAGSASALDGGAVTYSKAAGPLWLSVAADGTLSGTPGNGDIGNTTFTIAATDSHGQIGTATLQLAVLGTFTGELGLTDFAAIAARWLETGCVDTPACGGADLSGDNGVTTDDILAFADMWLIDKPYGTLVSQWTFDTDGLDEVSDHDGTLVNGAAVNTANANIGTGCLELDGTDDFVEITGYKGITGTSARTCSAWIKTTKTATEEIMAWGTQSDAGKWAVGIRNNVFSVRVKGGNIYGSTVINDGNWHHVAVTWDPGSSNMLANAILYVDGVEETISSFADIAVNTGDSESMKIGSFLNANYFQGLIDDVRIYDRALTAPEIEQLASFALHLHLPLDEVSGTAAADQSRFARPGQLQSTPVWQPTNGQIDGALQFDGVDDAVEITGYKGITGTAARTCSAWIKTTKTSTQEIMSWGALSDGSKWAVGVRNNVISVRVKSGNIYGSTVVNDGNWHHVAVTWQPGTNGMISNAKLYVDGLEETIGSLSDIVVNTGTDETAKLGNFMGANYFQGSIDDVKIYDRVLSQDEIQTIMNE